MTSGRACLALCVSHQAASADRDRRRTERVDALQQVVDGVAQHQRVTEALARGGARSRIT